MVLHYAGHGITLYWLWQYIILVVALYYTGSGIILTAALYWLWHYTSYIDCGIVLVWHYTSCGIVLVVALYRLWHSTGYGIVLRSGRP